MATGLRGEGGQGSCYSYSLQQGCYSYSLQPGCYSYSLQPGCYSYSLQPGNRFSHRAATATAYSRVLSPAVQLRPQQLRQLALPAALSYTVSIRIFLCACGRGRAGGHIYRANSYIYIYISSTSKGVQE